MSRSLLPRRAARTHGGSVGQTLSHTFGLHRGPRVRGLTHISHRGVFATPFARCWT
ncbi:hypothetical protein AB0I72_20450 [Nocardiopsis sp. NPDC049922]|uniref:hypothetical protein n=1 Tax=Nocardiopsis sp. NPDC049922 TaxID=3155157 RepID=UPI0033C5BDFF